PMGDAIVADVRLTLEALVQAAGDSDREPPTGGGGPDLSALAGQREDAGDGAPMGAGDAAQALADVFPEDGIAVVESPSATLAVRTRLALSKPGSWYFGAGGGLGFGLPASVGVQLAQPDRPVVC